MININQFFNIYINKVLLEMEDNYKKRMEDSTKLLEKQKDTLDECIIHLNETGETAEDSLQNLIGQREKIIKMTNKVENINDNLHTTNRNIKKMQWSNIKNKIIVIIIIVIIIAIILAIVALILVNLYNNFKS